jgi:hypothetical protein
MADDLLHKIYADEKTKEVVFIHAISTMLLSNKKIIIFTYLSKNDRDKEYLSLTFEQFFEKFNKRLPHFKIK